MKPKILLVVLGLLIALTATACMNGSKTQRLAGRNYKKEQASQQQALAEQLKQTPVEFPAYSDERANINERNIRLNDPAKLTYVYLLALDGSVVMHDVAKGKLSSCSSQILPEEGPVRYRGDDLVVPQPEPDGSFGTNGHCIFWFTPQGAYREWEGSYLMSDQPVTIANPVKLVVNARANVTQSVHAKTGNDNHR